MRFVTIDEILAGEELYNMKKLLSIVFACVLSCVTLFAVGCSSKTDTELVKSKGKLVIGVTDYAPFDYEKDGKWVGFDADMARLVGKKLDVEVEIVEINWNKKIVELQSKKVDLLWNAMTVTDDLRKNLDFSVSYAQNCQVAVIKKENATKYTNEETIKNAKIVAEGGSAGENVAIEKFGQGKVTGADSQLKALMEVSAGTADVAVIDYSMAACLCGTGDYENLSMVDGLRMSEEFFAVGARKGSDLVAVVDEVLKGAYKDGTMEKLRKQYGETSIVLCDLSK